MKISKQRLQEIIKEEIDTWHLKKMALVKHARNAAKKLQNRKLEALAHALELSLNNGIVMAKGSPFFGMTTRDLSMAIDQELADHNM